MTGQPDIPAPTIVVFDLGKVLLDWDPRYLYRRIFADAAEMEAFLADVCTSEWVLEADRGRPFAQGCAELAARFPHYAEPIRAFDERWQEMLVGEIEGAVALKRRLQARGAPLYAISNFSREKFAETAVRFPVVTEFLGIVVSAHEGLVKPDPAIFRLFLDRYGLNAAQCLFIDDSLANVRAARSVGMQATHFTTPEALEAELRGFGLL